MNHLISSQLVAAHQQCPRKAFFLLRGIPEPQPHEYKIVTQERAEKSWTIYLATASGITGRTTQLPQSPVVVSVGDLQATCDAVAHGRKRREREPHLVIGTRTPSSLDKARLAFAGYTMGEEYGCRPAFGVIVPFAGDSKRIKLGPLYSGISKAVDRLRAWTRQLPPDPPALIMGKQCQTCEFRETCQAEAEKSDSLYLLDKMTPKVAAKYQKKGIFTLTQLSYVYRPRRRRKGAGTAPTPFNVELQALAIRERKIYLHERPTLAQQPVELLLDIEGIPDQGFDYLVGLMVKKGDKTTMHSFWADGLDDESRIFNECLALVAKYPDVPIYHYGNYERRVIERVAEQHGLDCQSLIARLVNVNSLVYGKIYFPTRSNRLKDLGAAVRASWPTPNPSGIESIAWRYRWEDSGHEGFKDKLLAYNQADCNALRLLVTELQSLSTAADKRVDVDFAKKPKQSSTPTGESIHQAFDGIIHSAHFEYQEKRIRLRPRNVANREEETARSKPLRTSRQTIHPTGIKVVHVPRKRRCSVRHAPQNLEPFDKNAVRPIIDLVFTRSGCRKRTIHYVGARTYCPRCKRVYVPPMIKRLNKRVYSHAFQAWAVYQRVTMRLPYEPISELYDLLFREHVNISSIAEFMQQFAELYGPTERLLLSAILKSPAIHIDETKVNLRDINKYAWGVTDGKHVVFMLTDTRETEFLQGLLGGYDGVLVSDFYGGYDSMPCRQQKCLVHLIRDLNDDLWRNPFLAEYESFVIGVRDLLVPIFEDVDKYGLKKRHLQKHMKSVERFYRQSIDMAWESEVVQTYQKRFVRYREALFIFLNEDGIPWNNNAGERALRHLAVQRKISNTFVGRGATDYLRLLGIAQSCRFQNKSFLRFLLSEERDVDAFKDRKRRRRS